MVCRNEIFGFADFVHSFLCQRPINAIMILFTAFLAFGQKLVFISYNNDQCYALYSKPLGAIGQQRWGSSIFSLIGLSDRYVPFWSDFLGIGLLVLSSVIFAYYWYRVSKGGVTHNSLLFFILLYLSFPINVELYFYKACLLKCACYYSLSGIILLILDKVSSMEIDQCSADRKNIIPYKIVFYATTIILVAIISSAYETFVFVTTVSFLLTLIYKLSQNEFSVKRLLIETKPFVICFFWGLVLRQLLIAITMHWIRNDSGAGNQIAWFHMKTSILTYISKLIITWCYDYVYHSLFYFGLFIFWISTFSLLIWICRRKNKRLNIVLWIIVMCCIFAFTIIQGVSQPYRVCQAMPMLTATTGMMLVNTRKMFRRITILIVSWVILMQCKEINLLLTYERKSSEVSRERFVAIGNDIKSNPEYKNKELVFVGDIYDRMKYDETMASPWLKGVPRLGNVFSQHAGLTYLHSHSKQFPILLNYFTGLTEKEISEELRQEWEHKVKLENQPAWPEKGYIRTYDDNVVVNLGVEPEMKTWLDKNDFIEAWKKIFCK